MVVVSRMQDLFVMLTFYGCMFSCEHTFWW